MNRWKAGYALVGAGHRAGMYVRALAGSHADAGELVALLDPNDVRIEHHRQAYGGGPAGYHPDGFDAMLREQRPSTVIVTTVDRWHADYVVAALAAGCSVICEKPLTTDAEGCRRITEAARTATGTVAVTFNYRYSPRNSVCRSSCCCAGRSASRPRCTSSGCWTPITARTTSAAGTGTRCPPAGCSCTRRPTTSTW